MKRLETGANYFLKCKEKHSKEAFEVLVVCNVVIKYSLLWYPILRM